MYKILSIGDHSVIWQNSRLYWVLNEQLWYWTDEWQAREREVDEDIRLGRVETFDNMEDFIKSLEENKA